MGRIRFSSRVFSIGIAVAYCTDSRGVGIDVASGCFFLKQDAAFPLRSSSCCSLQSYVPVPVVVLLSLQHKLSLSSLKENLKIPPLAFAEYAVTTLFNQAQPDYYRCG